MLTDRIRKMFAEIRYSESGSIHRQYEERAFMHFIDHLDDCEKGNRIVMIAKHFN